MSLIKDIYSESFFAHLAVVFEEVLPQFERKLFLEKIYEDHFLEKEWKDRMIHVCDVMHVFMPNDFVPASVLLIKVVDYLQENDSTGESLAYIFLAEYISRYGLEHIKESVTALERTTQFISCEFAVRPFILKYPVQMLVQLDLWSNHPHYKVRRLSSEGSRPKLPWSMVIPKFQKQPHLTLAFLQNLMEDPHSWVRKSVANHLNDISKDHPNTVLSFAKTWQGKSKETDAIIKHGLRTLLKKAHPDTLAFYGLDAEGIVLSDLRIHHRQLTIGEVLHFQFQIENSLINEKTVRLEYAIYYQKANGQLSKKVYKISERTFQASEKRLINRKQSFRIITTRKFYLGKHQLAIITNGRESEAIDFDLIG